MPRYEFGGGYSEMLPERFREMRWRIIPNLVGDFGNGACSFSQQLACSLESHDPE